jgi:hypothetical protein
VLACASDDAALSRDGGVPAGRISRASQFAPPSRDHLPESVVRKAVAEAARLAGMTKRLARGLTRESIAGIERPWLFLVMRRRPRVTRTICRLA